MSQHDPWADVPDDIVAEEQFKRRRDQALARHPDCRDPDHPGCERCIEEEKDDELETRSTSRR